MLSIYFIAIIAIAIIIIITNIIAFKFLYNDVLEFMCVIFACIHSVILVASIIVLISSAIEKKFINENFNTNYTTEDIFFYGEDIKQMIIGKKFNIDAE